MLDVSSHFLENKSDSQEAPEARGPPGITEVEGRRTWSLCTAVLCDPGADVADETGLARRGHPKSKSAEEQIWDIEKEIFCVPVCYNPKGLLKRAP